MQTPKGLAPGCSGLRAEHLKAVLCDRNLELAAQALTLLTGFVNQSLNGYLPPDLQPCLCGGRLIPLIKKDSGVRPLVVGELLRALRPGIKVCPERSNPPTHSIAATPAGRRQGWSRYPCCCSNSQVLDTVTRAGRSAPENRYQQRIQQHRPRCVLEGSRKILPRFTEMGTLVSQWCQ